MLGFQVMQLRKKHSCGRGKEQKRLVEFLAASAAGCLKGSFQARKCY